MHIKQQRSGFERVRVLVQQSEVQCPINGFIRSILNINCSRHLAAEFRFSDDWRGWDRLKCGRGRDCQLKTISQQEKDEKMTDLIELLSRPHLTSPRVRRARESDPKCPPAAVQKQEKREKQQQKSKHQWPGTRSSNQMYRWILILLQFLNCISHTLASADITGEWGREKRI